MTEEALHDAPSPQAPDGAAPASAGALLRQAREAAGVHLAALAVALKVPVSKLDALERDDYLALPDVVFTRALAASVCRTLKTDAAPVLALMPQGQPARLTDSDQGINAPFKATALPPSSAAAGLGAGLSRGVALAVLALLLGAAAVYFVPWQRAGDSASAWLPSAGPAGDAGRVAEPSLPVASDEASAAAFAAPAGSAAGPEARNANPAAPSSFGMATAGAAPAATAPAAAASGAENAAAPSGLVVFRARGDSWIQVRDATGATTLQRNLAAGQSVAASGAPPLAVVVGRADVTDVEVRGKPFELSGVSRSNVARFEVK